jgi:hypothetical protein
MSSCARTEATDPGTDWLPRNNPGGLLALAVAHRLPESVCASAAHPGVRVAMSQFPVAILPAVNLRDPQGHVLIGAAGDRRGGPLVADDVRQVPADTGRHHVKVDGAAAGVHRRHPADGLADVGPARLTGLRCGEQGHRIVGRQLVDEGSWVTAANFGRRLAVTLDSSPEGVVKLVHLTTVWPAKPRRTGDEDSPHVLRADSRADTRWKDFNEKQCVMRAVGCLGVFRPRQIGASPHRVPFDEVLSWRICCPESESATQ